MSPIQPQNDTDVVISRRLSTAHEMLSTLTMHTKRYETAGLLEAKKKQC
jgi:hypothetical protein